VLICEIIGDCVSNKKSV